MRYPIGIQTFEKIIRGGYVYVDKTAYVHDLASYESTFFLGRPRRFGKSLLLSTLHSYFRGEKDLFRGLAIDKLEQEWKCYPVMHFSFGSGNYKNQNELEEVLRVLLSEQETVYGITSPSSSLAQRFRQIIKAAHDKTGERVVVLIDEYDKPLLDAMEEHSRVEQNGVKVTLEDYNRNILKSFYSALKDADEHLRFVMLTGVTKFSQISVFSGFNQPKDISMDSRYEGICGITAEELDAQFAKPIEDLAEAEGLTVEKEKELLKQLYDGYHFGPHMTDVYNPFSLLSCFDQKGRDNYWFRTGTPGYLTKLLQHTDSCLNELVNQWYDTADFVDYKADAQKPLPMLYQSGYLTIKACDPHRRKYLLGFPNEEVSKGLIDFLSSGY
ncbi:MAG: AAA family ATPase [Alloprevotella sp.]